MEPTCHSAQMAESVDHDALSGAEHAPDHQSEETGPRASRFSSTAAYGAGINVAVRGARVDAAGTRGLRHASNSRVLAGVCDPVPIFGYGSLMDVDSAKRSVRLRSYCHASTTGFERCFNLVSLGRIKSDGPSVWHTNEVCAVAVRRSREISVKLLGVVLFVPRADLPYYLRRERRYRFTDTKARFCQHHWSLTRATPVLHLNHPLSVMSLMRLSASRAVTKRTALRSMMIANGRRK